MTRSALVVEVPAAEPVVGGWRRAHDPIARYGMPAHVTVLYPFRPVPLDPADRRLLGGALADQEPFSFSLDAVDTFPDAVFLRPEPAARFEALTRAVWAAFPAYPPYGGRFGDIRPHLTVGQVAAGPAQDRLVAEVEEALGSPALLACEVTAVTLFATDIADRRWSPVERLPLGG